MDNLKIYNAVRAVPKEALKEIQAGRLKGKSDINPMWRIKALTEQFGLCGVGWKYEITEKRLEHGGGNEIAAFVDINLYIKVDGVWSDAIPGTGGSSFVAQEKNGPYTSDECFKMALTDAISVSCKALGFGADVYWGADNTKYTPRPQAPVQQASKAQGTTQPWAMSDDQRKAMFALAKTKNIDLATTGPILTGKQSSKEWAKADYDKVMEELKKC